ncbi:MAG: radical SAM protein [Bacillota bacterium]|nr:radical SAM protein [Bacillota bacterium]
MFRALYSDDRGNMFDEGSLAALGRSWNEIWELRGGDMIPLPEGSTFAMLPGRQAVGMSPATGEALAIWLRPRMSQASRTRGGEGETPGWAVGALLPAGFTRTLLPAFVPAGTRQAHQALPLYGYAAVGMGDGQPYVAAMKTDDPSRWDPREYDSPGLRGLVDARLRECPGNRILRQLSRCSLEYHCFTAQNVFYRRWEAGIPVSPACPASCIGCISLQPAECCPSAQTRIDFVPTLDEVVEIALPHLRDAAHAIISFGQGCEGEPLLQSDLIARAIARVRAEVRGRGFINVNTSAGLTGAVAKICEAGLDGMRVSMVSAREEIYLGYHRPSGYGLADVEASMAIAKASGVFVSLNLLVFPGLTDREEELDALCALIERAHIDMVQLRNLNIDPDVLTGALPGPRGRVLGIDVFVRDLQARCPDLRIGSFTPSREEVSCSARPG